MPQSSSCASPVEGQLHPVRELRSLISEHRFSRPVVTLCSVDEEVGEVKQFCDGSSSLSSCVSTLNSTIISVCNEAHGTASPPRPDLAGTFPGPPHGVKAICGKRAKMEDAFAVCCNLFDVQGCLEEGTEKDCLPARLAAEILRGLGDKGEGTATPDATPQPMSILSPDSPTDISAGNDQSMESEEVEGDSIHFFAVYDGHGGSEVRAHYSCVQKSLMLNKAG